MTETARPDDLSADGALAFREGRIQATLDLRVYRLSALQKAAYRLATRCTVVFGEVRGESLPVTLLFPRGTREPDALESARLFFQEALDQELREKIGEETAPLRTLLLAHAFSRTKLAPG